MNKVFIRRVLLLVTAGVLILIIFRNRSPFGRSNSSFNSEPKTGITRIEFSNEEMDLLLEKEGDSWMLNGKLQPRKSSVLFIERILKEMNIKSPVSAELFDEEIVDKGIFPVRVKVYEKRRLLNTFLVYKTRSNLYGNIMKKSKNAKPFVVYVPGYEGDIGSAFTLNELYWQNYTVFSLLPSEISSVNFENLSDTASSFKIVSKNHHYTLFGKAGELSGWDTTLVTRYLSYFTMIPFEAWAFETGEEDKEETESQTPLYRITVTTPEDSTIVLTLWERIIGESNIADSDRLFGKTQNSDELFVMRYFDIDPLIKKKSYFFPE